MAISLYDVTVRSFLQTLGAVAGFLDKGAGAGLDLVEIAEARVAPDMLPFRFQIQSVVHHSLEAIEGAKKGLFLPPSDIPAHSYGELQALVAGAIAGLKALTREEVEALQGKEVIFQLGRDFKLPFTAEGFLTSFSLPNLHFHATVAYGLLRARGVKLGKRDYLGAMWLKG